MRRSCNVQSFVSALLEGCPEIFMSHGFLSCDVMPATVLLVVSTIAMLNDATCNLSCCVQYSSVAIS